MGLGRKGPAYWSATKEQRILRATGLPSRYWDVEVDAIDALMRRSASIQYHKDWVEGGLHRTVLVPAQRALVSELAGDALKRSAVVAIGSEPTDELGMMLAAALLRRARGQQLRCRCVGIQHGPRDARFSNDIDVLILHNLPSDCHQMRSQLCRDWLEWFDDTLRIVVVAGACPAWFMHKRLAYPADGFVRLRGEREDL